MEDQIIFQLQLITHPTGTSKAAVLFQDPFPLIYSMHWDFTPASVTGCVISLPLFRGILSWV